MRRILLLSILCFIGVSTPIAFAQVYNVQPEATYNTKILDPNAAGHPGSYMHDDTTLRDLGIPGLTEKKLTTHLLIDEKGSGDNCRAGERAPLGWQLDPNISIDTKDKLLTVVHQALANDTRIRQMYIYDDQIEIFYLQPATFWGFIPINYHLRISASGNTLRMALDKPNWLKYTNNYHPRVTEAFSTLTPTLLTADTVARMEPLEVIARDAKMIEIITSIMYQVNVSPFTNSFFVCYVLPFLLYILLFIVIACVIGFFFIRKIRRETAVQEFRMIHHIENDTDNLDRAV